MFASLSKNVYQVTEIIRKLQISIFPFLLQNLYTQRFKFSKFQIDNFIL